MHQIKIIIKIIHLFFCLAKTTGSKYQYTTKPYDFIPHDCNSFEKYKFIFKLAYLKWFACK